MTFRTRLVMAATIAVMMAVVLGSIAAYVVAHNSLVGSIDVNLSQGAQFNVNQQNIPNACNRAAVTLPTPHKRSIGKGDRKLASVPGAIITSPCGLP